MTVAQNSFLPFTFAKLPICYRSIIISSEFLQIPSAYCWSFFTTCLYSEIIFTSLWQTVILRQNNHLLTYNNFTQEDDDGQLLMHRSSTCNSIPLAILLISVLTTRIACCILMKIVPIYYSSFMNCSPISRKHKMEKNMLPLIIIFCPLLV